MHFYLICDWSKNIDQNRGESEQNRNLFCRLAKLGYGRDGFFCKTYVWYVTQPSKKARGVLSRSCFWLLRWNAIIPNNDVDEV